ncbi:rhodanese-like domain-containing protein [Luteolibacter ambystomatis]|uniref:Rhodanese-like domain-containing protein n=1 Tax=Luteolibacter ambystomatis TaxID=2824561 RepID=A0A975G852_9BACT|nr:rhodanese-like domain-containing protein [Luteolibacter ambystomatis]QUE50558.1 rhodanese-like domain-containing protein [Luteolibacter ambystomatis]
MKTIAILTLLPALLCAETSSTPAQQQKAEPNPRIDYPGFVQTATDLQKVREANRVSEDDFLRMMGESGTVVLDARSKARFDEMHVKGALHLDLTDFNAPALEKLIPDKTTRILIYCNNNFKGAERPFPAKAVQVALNVQTFINLHTYGYRNVKELAPLIEISKVKLPMEGTTVTK